MCCIGLSVRWSIGVTGSLFRRPRCRPLFLFLFRSSSVSLCSFVLPPRPCTAHPPSHCVHGHWLGLWSGAGVEEDAGETDEGLTWFRRRRRQGERRGAGARMSGRREGTLLSRRGVPPSPRPSCSDCGALPSAGCCMCCSAVGWVCALCA